MRVTAVQRCAPKMLTVARWQTTGGSLQKMLMQIMIILVPPPLSRSLEPL